MPEKKNILPLLAIAFVVAIICTGVFYGLFAGKLRTSASAAPAPVLVVATRPLTRGTILQTSDLREAPWTAATPGGSFSKTADITGWMVLEPVKTGEPLTQTRVASLKSGAGLAAVVPNGMRAVSVRTADSPGVTGLLRPGYRVDVQYVGVRPNVNNNEPELRTILQDVEVLAINPQQELPNRAGLVVVTLLAKPEEADMLSLADTNLRVRLVLRNPGDHDRSTAGNISVASLLRAGAVERTSYAIPSVKLMANAGAGSIPLTGDERVSLLVQMIGTDATAFENLKLPASGSPLQIARIAPDVKVPDVVHQLTEQGHWEVLSSTRLMSGGSLPVSVQANALDLQLRSWPLGGGRVRVRVQPRLEEAALLPASDVDLWAGQSVAVTGLPSAPTPLVDRLFPLPGGGSHRQQQFLILVTPRVTLHHTVAAAEKAPVTAAVRPQGE